MCKKEKLMKPIDNRITREVERLSSFGKIHLRRDNRGYWKTCCIIEIGQSRVIIDGISTREAMESLEYLEEQIKKFI